jgi:hypothetical protein
LRSTTSPMCRSPIGEPMFQSAGTIVNKMLARNAERTPGWKISGRPSASPRRVGRCAEPEARLSAWRRWVTLVRGRGITAVWWWTAYRRAPVAETASIAVLPFANMSEQQRRLFLGWAIRRTLNALARVEGLHVAARRRFSSGPRRRCGGNRKQLNVSTSRRQRATVRTVCG